MPFIKGSIKSSKYYYHQYTPCRNNLHGFAVQCTKQQDSKNEIFTPVSELADRCAHARRKKWGRRTGIGKKVSRKDKNDNHPNENGDPRHSRLRHTRKNRELRH